MKSENKKRFLSQLLIGVVLFINVQCALIFLMNPTGYMHGFGLEGATGEQMVRALGLLFLMWNVPYIFSLVDPFRYKISLIEAVIMQGIGLTGEASILIIWGPYPSLIEATIMRFILFDGIGLVFLVTALVLVIQENKRIKGSR